MSIFLSVITCGIYAIYWYYCILDDLYRSNNVPSTAGRDIVLTIVTCGIYGIYMYYQMGQLVNSARLNYGLPEKNDSILYLILGIFGLGIVVYALVQNELNESLAYVVNNNVVYKDNNQQNTNNDYGYNQDNNNNDDSQN